MDYLPSNTVYLGIGGVEMQKRGLKSLFPMEELSVMGFLEVVPRYLNIRKRLFETVDKILKENPSVVLTVDAYSFHVRLAEQLRQRGFKGRLCHYVSPSVWAWKKGRAKELACFYDEVYCIFPFEPAYFEPYNIRAEFVGHPAAFRLPAPDPSFRHRYRLNDAPILMILPGSRLQEIDKLYEVFIKASEIARQTYPDLQIVVPTLPHLVTTIEAINQRLNAHVTLITDCQDRFACFSQARVALAASGTVALELALNKIPCVIGYKTSAVTYFLAKCFAKVKYITVLNIMANKELIPEFLQDLCTPENLAQSLEICLQQTDLTSQSKEVELQTALLKKATGLKPQEIVANRLLNARIDDCKSKDD